MSQVQIHETSSAETQKKVNTETATDDKRSIYPASLVWAVAMTCLVAGLCCNLAVKLQNRASAPICEGCEEKKFDQPLWQTFIMFCGEAFCFFVWMFDEYYLRRKNNRAYGYLEFPAGDDLTRPRSTYLFAIPAFIDLTGTAVVNAAFVLTYVSTVQMLRNSLLIMTALMSIVMMKRPLRVHEWLGIFVMTVSMIVSGIQAVVNPDTSSDYDPSLAWLGIVLTIGATVLNALHLVTEEKIFQRGYCPPMKAQGLEGLFGIVFNIIALVIAHYSGFYNFSHAWHQMNNSTPILIGNIWYLIVVGIFNGAGIVTTFVSSAVFRSVIYSSRAPILFVLEIIIGWQDSSVLGWLSVVLFIIGFVVFSYLIPYVNKRRTPKAHRAMRKGVNCFCTKPLPESDDEVSVAAEDVAERVETV